MQSPPSLAGSCHILPRTTTPHTQTQSPPSCPALFPCKSYRFQWCSHNCQSHVQLGLCPQGLAHPGPELGVPPTSTALSTSQKPAGGEEGGGRTQRTETPWNIWGYLWQRAGLVPRWAGSFPPAGWEHPSIQGSRLQTPRLQRKPRWLVGRLSPPPSIPPAPGRKGSMHHLPPSE